MKKLVLLLMLFSLALPAAPLPSLNAKASETRPQMAIVIDDFGGWDQSGTATMLSIDAPLTIAVIPDVDNTAKNVAEAKNAKKEVIVHMPMSAHVHLPENWYGTYHISVGDSKETVFEKLDKAFKSVEGACGFNIHIGSGVCQDRQTVGYVYDWAKENGKFFLDSRTHTGTICEEVANKKGVKYLGRSEFLEPEGNRSYEGVCHHLLEGAKIAKEKGTAIVIGHVGSHGGENTARAIKDTLPTLKKMGIDIVPLSALAS